MPGHDSGVGPGCRHLSSGGYRCRGRGGGGNRGGHRGVGRQHTHHMLHEELLLLQLVEAAPLVHALELLQNLLAAAKTEGAFNKG